MPPSSSYKCKSQSIGEKKEWDKAKLTCQKRTLYPPAKISSGPAGGEEINKKYKSF